MKNLYLLALTCLLGRGIYAQPDQRYLGKRDSTLLDLKQPDKHNGDSLKHLTSSTPAATPAIRTFTGIRLPELVSAVSRVQTELIPVRKGDSLRIALYTRYDPGRRFNTVLRQSLENATLTYITNPPVAAKQMSSPTAEQPNRSRVGIGIVLPLAQVLRIGRRPDAWLQYDLYTQDSVLLTTVTEPLSRSARKRWSVSRMLVNVPENGFFRLSYVNRSHRQVWLSGLSVDSSPPEISTHLSTSARSAADSSAADSLDAPTGKPAGSLADELGLQSNGECGPDPGCAVCNPPASVTTPANASRDRACPSTSVASAMSARPVMMPVNATHSIASIASRLPMIAGATPTTAGLTPARTTPTVASAIRPTAGVEGEGVAGVVTRPRKIHRM